MNSRNAPTRRYAPRMIVAACLTVLVAISGVGSADAAPSRSVSSVDSLQVSFAGPTFASETNETVDVVVDDAVTVANDVLEHRP